MKHTTSHAIQTIEQTSHVLFWAMATGLFVLASLYIYFVNKTVWNVVARQTAESEIVAIGSDLSATEFDYIKAKGNISLALAESLGFRDADKQTLFVTKESAPKSVALR